MTGTRAFYPSPPRRKDSAGFSGSGLNAQIEPVRKWPRPNPTFEPSRQEVGRQADDGLPPPSAEKHCGAGSSGIAVDPYGNVYPCVQWRRPVGNLHEKSIKEIWAQSTALKEIRELTVEAKKLVDGYRSRGPLLNFCPGSAVMNTGSPIRVHSAVENRMEILQEVEKERKTIQLSVLP